MHADTGRFAQIERGFGRLAHHRAVAHIHARAKVSLQRGVTAARLQAVRHEAGEFVEGLDGAAGFGLDVERHAHAGALLDARRLNQFAGFNVKIHPVFKLVLNFFHGPHRGLTWRHVMAGWVNREARDFLTDAACEIANIVGCNVKTYLNANGYSLNLDIPFVVDPQPSAEEAVHLHFALNEDQMFVGVSTEPSQPNYQHA